MVLHVLHVDLNTNTGVFSGDGTMELGMSGEEEQKLEQRRGESLLWAPFDYQAGDVCDINGLQTSAL